MLVTGSSRGIGAATALLASRRGYAVCINYHSNAAAAERLLPRGSTVGRYVVLQLVGRGAMGEVYAAFDPELNRKVALKLLRSPVPADPSTGDGEARLVREAQAMARLNHPHVVAVYDAGPLPDGSLFIAMEYVEGQNLRQWREQQPRSWREVLEA